MASPDFDERLGAIKQTLELVSQMQLANEQNIKELTARANKHEQEWERFRRTMRAALTEWFSENGNEDEQ